MSVARHTCAMWAESCAAGREPTPNLQAVIAGEEPCSIRHIPDPNDGREIKQTTTLCMFYNRLFDCSTT